jgi:hypothetical protein
MQPYLYAFPDFGELDIQVPANFNDTSYKNDTCPSFSSTKFSNGSSLVLFVDYKGVEKREYEDTKRFILVLRDEEDTYVKDLVLTDDYAEILKAIAEYQTK